MTCPRSRLFRCDRERQPR